MNKKINGINQILLVLIIAAAVTGFSSCDKYSFPLPSVSAEDTLHFSTDIQPIFTANCIICHGAIRPPDLRAGGSFQALVEGNYITLPGETSELYLIMTDSDHASRSSSAEKQKVLIWINQGALDN